MPASKRCIFFAGAPETEDLKWDEAALLTSFRPPIKRFLVDEDAFNGEAISQATPPSSFAKWRSVPCDGTILHEHDDQRYQARTQFLSFEDRDEIVPQDEFLERSIALLDDLDSSHIIPRATMPDADSDSRLETTFLSTTTFTTSSFNTNSPRTTNGSFLDPSTEGRSSVDISGPVTDLKQIPNAEYIARIQPQTITVNLIVGIIAISATRTVRLRRRAAEMDIIDLTVGDDTRAGFSISFWLVPVQSQRKPADDLRQVLTKLRSGDVVSLENVALSCWKGSVYGQSLSRRFARNSTSVSVLGDAGAAGPCQLKLKVERVREWTRDFVGVAKRSSTVKYTSRDLDALPPDTPD